MATHAAISKNKLMSTSALGKVEMSNLLAQIQIESLAPFVPNAVVIHHSTSEGILVEVSPLSPLSVPLSLPLSLRARESKRARGDRERVTCRYTSDAPPLSTQ